jgi:hypothetical protein
LDYCVVVFSNDECELFESEDEARIQRQSLPDGMVKGFTVFPSLADAQMFMKLIKSRAEAECNTEEPLMPGTEDGVCASKIAAVTPEKKKNHSAFLKSISSGQNNKSRFGQVLAGTMVAQKAGNTV